MSNKPELLSPAGSPESLRAAIEAGADAVYLAGKRFGARRSAANFSDDELKEALRYVHLAGAKAYVTVNTLLFDDELPDALDFLADIYSWGADAAIVQDLGLVSLARDSFHIELHASTQWGVHDVNGALAAMELGFTRAILARELPIADVAEISSAIETEVFVHGALCYSYSGQCLMSSFIGGRSGNRGGCAQPCRMEYEIKEVRNTGPYLLSTRDLNTLQRLDEIVKAGVSGLKIEGRMRSPEYVALATAAYRRALDTGEMPDGEQAKMLALAFNREFTRGYMLGARHANLTNHSVQNNAGLRLGKVVSAGGQWMRARVLEGMKVGPGDGLKVGSTGGIVLAIENSVDGLFDLKIDAKATAGDDIFLTSSPRLAEAARSARPGKRRAMGMSLEVAAGKPMRISVRTGDYSVELEGAEAVKAEKRPLTEEAVRKAVGALGDTPFELSKLDVSIAPGSFAPVGAIKELRRTVVEALVGKISESFLREKTGVGITSRRADKPSLGSEKPAPKLIARTRNPRAAQGLLDAGADLVLLDNLYGLSGDMEFLDGIEGNDRVVIELPRITTNRFFRLAGERLKSFKGPLMAHTLGARRFFGKNASFGGFSLNIANSQTARAVRPLFESVEASPEASAAELGAISSAIDTWVSVHGRQEVMVTEDCILGSEGGCEDCGHGLNCRGDSTERRRFSVTDLKGYEFPVVVDAECRSHVYNSAETCMADMLGEVVATGVGGLVLNLQLMEPPQAEEIAKLYRKMLAAIQDGRGIPDSDVLAVKALSSKKLTRGHFDERAL
ncbi:MAG: U32 family peptidase [Methanobacteriota archaeon]